MTPLDSPSTDIAISVRNLSKTYRLFGHPGDRIRQFFSLGLKQYHREFAALSDVSFDIRKGETVGIIGRNGSGKSTLLQLICGILKPTQGSVSVRGRVSALLELGAGFNPEFTGRENVFFQGTLMGLTRGQMEARFDEIASFADIGEFMDQPVRVYSSGMFVRLAFAAATHVDPDILVVDEALAVGDAAFQSKCMNRIRQLQARGISVLLVSHDLNQIAAHCDRAFLLDHGRLLQSSSPKSAIDEYRRVLNTRAPVPRTAAQGSANTSGRQATSLHQRDSSEVRYGSFDAEILEAGWFDENLNAAQILSHGQRYALKIRLLSHCAGLRPFVSYVIKDAKGMVVCGTNTLIEGLDLGVLSCNEEAVITFSLPMLLTPGTWLLSVGVQGTGIEDNPVAYDHRTDYLTFQVTGPLRHGQFSPPLALQIEKSVC